MTHTHTHTFHHLLKVAVVTLALLPGKRSADAQTPRFQLTPLVKLGFAPNPDSDGTIGMNNKGQVAFGYMTEEDVMHAWIWLPEADYGLSAGFHDLHDLPVANNSTPEPSIARDINESGIIAGQVDFSVAIAGEGNGAAWTCATGEIDYTALGMFAGPGNPWSGAWAVNDAVNPVIVGVSRVEGICSCPPASIEKDVERGFRLVLSAPTSLTELPVSPDRQGQAFDVNTPLGPGGARIAGFTTCSGTQENTCFAISDQCHPATDPVLWVSTTRTPLTSLEGEGDNARDLNNDGKIVGWGFDELETQECERRAMFWASQTATPVNLGDDDTMPDGQEGDASRAEAINNLTLPQVVGWNASQNFALLWEQQTGGGWIVTDMNTAIGGCSTTEWLLLQGHDINDDGWIAALAFHDPTNEFYAVLLTPFSQPTCPGDVNNSGCVDVDDYIAVILAWGPCQVGSFCNEDVDRDCEVEVDDLIAVLADWGCGCSSLAPPTPPSLEEQIEIVLEAPISPNTQAEIIEALLTQGD